MNKHLTRAFANGSGFGPVPYFPFSEPFQVATKRSPNGKVESRMEIGSGAENHGYTLWNYAYDAKGRLTDVCRGSHVVEHYIYDRQGRRIQAKYRVTPNFCGFVTRDFVYDKQGRLIKAGDTAYTWTAQGQLQSRRDSYGRTQFFYGNDTLLMRPFCPRTRS